MDEYDIKISVIDSVLAELLAQQRELFQTSSTLSGKLAGLEEAHQVITGYSDRILELGRKESDDHLEEAAVVTQHFKRVCDQLVSSVESVKSAAIVASAGAPVIQESIKRIIQIRKSIKQ